MKPAPQALQTIEPVPGQPGLEFAVGLDFFLQRLECFCFCRQVGAFGRLGVDNLLPGAALFVQQRYAERQLFQTCLGLKLCLLRSVELGRQVSQPRFIGRIQGVAVGSQLFAAQAQAARLLFDIALVCGQHLYLLLHLGHGTALLVSLCLRAAQGLFQGGQLALLLFALCRQQLDTFFAVFGLGLQVFKLAGRVVLARCPLGGLLLELLQPLLYTHPAIDHKADFSLQAADFGAGLV